MKKIIFVLSFIFLAAASFAQSRVLTQTEKEMLRVDPVFKMQCEWAIKEYATYWSIQTGVGCATETDCLNWAKKRLLSVHVLTKGIQNFGEITTADIFLDGAKAKQLDYGAGDPSSVVIIQEWLDNNTFEEMADYYFKIWGDGVNMSIGN